MSPSELVASALSISLPDDYAEFLNNTGYLFLTNLAIEVYGYQQGFDIQKIPCVIAARKLNNGLYNLSASEIVISHTGFEELIITLDCTTGKVYERGFDGARSEIAESFKTWLAQIIKKNDETA
jgi:hypothetical protein